MRNRYKKGRDAVAAQVEALQREPAFLVEARQWYARGYKDWILVSAIVNVVGNAVVRERGLMPKPGERPKPVPANFMLEATKGRVLPTTHFLGEEFARMITMFELTALESNGFRPRSRYFDPTKVQVFLRDRLAFYDFDYDHPLLFGDPPGTWPQL